MIKSLIAAEVREQSQLVRRDIQIELARHTQELNTKLDAHDTAIAEMRASQQETSSDIKALLLQIGQSMNIPNFGGGVSRAVQAPANNTPHKTICWMEVSVPNSTCSTKRGPNGSGCTS